MCHNYATIMPHNGTSLHLPQRPGFGARNGYHGGGGRGLRRTSSHSRKGDTMFWVIHEDAAGNRLPMGSWDDMAALSRLLSTPLPDGCWFKVSYAPNLLQLR